MRRLAGALIAAGLLAASASLAQDRAPAAPADERAEARALAQQGDAAFGSGRCDKAIGLWRRAESKFHATTILLRIARCQALMGKVVEATATLERIAADPLGPDAPPPFVEARDAAVRELPGVRERIAVLTVAIGAANIAVTPVIVIDGQTQRAGETTFRVDPGTHLVRVRAREALWERSVQVDDGETRSIEVTLAAETPPPPARTQRTAGFVIGGAGLLAFGVGAVFGFSAADTARELEAVCGPDRARCPPDREDAVARVKAHALAADVTLGAGVVLFATGAVLVLTAPPPRVEAPRIRVVASGLGLGVEGRY